MNRKLQIGAWVALLTLVIFIIYSLCWIIALSTIEFPD